MIEAGFLHEKGADLHAEITTWTHLTRNQSTKLLYPLPLSMLAVAVGPGNPPEHDTGFVVRESRNSEIGHIRLFYHQLHAVCIRHLNALCSPG
jgi:hypothetical protein